MSPRTMAVCGQRVLATLWLLFGGASCSSDSVACPTSITGWVEVVVHSEFACDELKVRFSQGETVLAESTDTVRGYTIDECVSSFFPPESSRIGSLTVLVLNQDDAELASKDVSRHFNDACGQYDDLVVEISLAR